jgi:SH3-like domain-containing protein
MKKAWALICAAVIALGVSDAEARRLEVLKDSHIRILPDKEATSINVALQGDTLPLIEESDRWYKVRHKGAEGWIYSNQTRVLPDHAAGLFTNQDVTVPPPDLTHEAEQQVKYARALKSGTIIRSHVDPKHKDARLLHTIRGRDEVFPLVHEGVSWSLVAVNDTVGWIKRADIEVLDERPTTSAAVSDAKIVLIGLAAAGALILIFLSFITYRHIRNERKRNVYVQKNVLILTKEGKSVQYTLTNTAGPVERCFAELGFNVTLVKDSVVARNNIEHNTPDLILIDWNFEPSIFAKIENLFARLPGASGTYVLFFNVPDLSTAPQSKVLRNVSFLGITVSDRDIFSVVTPLLVHAEQPSKNIQKSLQRCALEGEIAGGNLLEVLQFIEIGSKTGCLMVETKGPFGLVYFRDGRIIYAAAAKGQGVDAVYAILNQPSGKFRFITNKQPKAANLNLPTLSVLMEWTREKDESRRS